jgi:hypothetical protein
MCIPLIRPLAGIVPPVGNSMPWTILPSVIGADVSLM